jgi:hypothetical protein
LDQSPSRTWASKLAFDAARSGGPRRLLPLLLLLLSACESDYALTPTVCDDYCRATQRAECDDDAPADCVRECERRRRPDDCDTALAALGECYEHRDASAFYCEDNHTRIAPVCLSERRALDECTLPGSGPCFDQCVRQTDICKAPLDDCERDCLHPSPRCRDASRRYGACLLGLPVECRDWLQPETRPPEEVPCFDEALALLACDD